MKGRGFSRQRESSEGVCRAGEAQNRRATCAAVTFQNRSPPNLHELGAAAHCTEEDTEAQTCSASDCCPGRFPGSPGDFCCYFNNPRAACFRGGLLCLEQTPGSPAGRQGCQRGRRQRRHGMPHEIFLPCFPVHSPVTVRALQEGGHECASPCQINCKALCLVVNTSLLDGLSPFCPLLANKGKAPYPSSQSGPWLSPCLSTWFVS